MALAVLAASGMALFAAVSQSVQMLTRAEDARTQDAALRNGLALIQHVDPLAQPRGQVVMDGLTLRWSSRLVEPMRDGVTGYLQPGLHELGLFDVTLVLVRDGRVVREAVVRRAAYRQVRSPAQL